MLLIQRQEELAQFMTQQVVINKQHPTRKERQTLDQILQQSLELWMEMTAAQMQLHSLKMHVWVLQQFLEKDLPIKKAQAFGYKLHKHIAASHQEFVEIIKDQEVRSNIWLATSACLEHAALMALFEYEDIRKTFISSKARIWAEGIFNRAPAIAAWLMEDENERVWVEEKLTIKTLEWINQHYPAKMRQLLKYESVLQTLEANPHNFMAFIKQQPNTYLELLRSRVKSDFLALALRQHFVDLDDVSPLYLYEMQTQHCAKTFYQQIKQQGSALTVATQIYDNWFYDRHQMTRELALQMLKPLTDAQVNPDEISRYRAHYYCVELHMHAREHKQAKQHLVQLRDAKEALTADEHDQVIKYHQLVQQSQPQHTFFAQTSSHRSHLEADARAVYDDMFTSDLKQILSSLTKQLNHYTKQRNTSGLFYALGFKNRQLSEAKNNLVAVLCEDIKAAQHSLNTVESAEEAAVIAQKLSNQLAYAEKINKDLHQRYGRAMDSKGTLGNQLHSLSDVLRNFTIYQNGHSFVR